MHGPCTDPALGCDRPELDLVPYGGTLVDRGLKAGRETGPGGARMMLRRVPRGCVLESPRPRGSQSYLWVLTSRMFDDLFSALTAFSAARWRRPPNLQKAVRYFRTITELLCSKPSNLAVHFGSVCLLPLRLPLPYLHLLLAVFQFALALLPRCLGLVELRLQ